MSLAKLLTRENRLFLNWITHTHTRNSSQARWRTNNKHPKHDSHPWRCLLRLEQKREWFFSAYSSATRAYLCRGSEFTSHGERIFTIGIVARITIVDATKWESMWTSWKNPLVEYLRKSQCILIEMQSSSITDTDMQGHVFSIEVLHHRSTCLFHQFLSETQTTMCSTNSLIEWRGIFPRCSFQKNLTREVMWPCGTVSSPSSSLNNESSSSFHSNGEKELLHFR